MIENNNLDFEILEFNDNFIGEDTLTDKIDALNQSEETEEEEDEDKELINSELVDEDNLEDLDLTEEEKEIILKKKEKEAAKSEKEDTSEESEEEEGEEEEANPLKIFASELAEKNLLNLPEDWNGDEEALFEAYEQTLEDRASQIVKQAYKIDNPKVDGLLKYLKNGGDVNEYISTYEQTNWVDVNIEDEDNAIALVTTYLKNVKNLDDDEANALVQGYSDKGKLFSRAEEIQNELQAYREHEQQKLVDAQEEYMKHQRDQYFKTISKIKEVIQKGKTNNVVIAKSEKNNFEDFIFTPMEIKNDKGEVLGSATGFKKVLNEYLSDPEKMVSLAYKLYEGLTDKSDKVEMESKVKSRLADAIKSKSGKVKTERIKLEFIN
jgi:hypothetical protein